MIMVWGRSPSRSGAELLVESFRGEATRNLNTFAYLTKNDNQFRQQFRTLTFRICEKVSRPVILTNAKGEVFPSSPPRNRPLMAVGRVGVHADRSQRRRKPLSGETTTASDVCTLQFRRRLFIALCSIFYTSFVVHCSKAYFCCRHCEQPIVN